jgi:hypothetical protein
MHGFGLVWQPAGVPDEVEGRLGCGADVAGEGGRGIRSVPVLPLLKNTVAVLVEILIEPDVFNPFDLPEVCGEAD